jgi:ADP-ribose pyrophosphatase
VSPTDPGRHTEDGLHDLFVDRTVVQRELMHKGLIWDVVRDTVELGEAGVVRREYVDHPGAVCVLALDEQERILLLRQYRHPVRMALWEPPAGLLDMAGEPPLEAARRELAEEADLVADRWDVLVDWFNSPGGMNEALRCFLARGLHAVPEHERHRRTGEEVDMPLRWVSLEEARDAVLSGRIHNPAAVISILSAFAARDAGWTTLRPADSPWPEHPAHR